jgi:predicted RNA-binding Zn-ribbon protein involved in translation (DUF1610 family)
VVVGRFREPHLAYLAKGKLESEGIHAAVRDEYTAGIQWLHSDAIGGVKLAVAEPDAERAIAVLREDHSAEVLDDEDTLTGFESWDRCPKCGGQAIALQQASRKAGALSLLFGLPIIFWKKRYRCEFCGHTWKP